MGDPLICTASEPLFSHQENACYASDSPLQPADNSNEFLAQGRIGFDPNDGFSSSKPPSLFTSSNQLVCRGPYASFEDYLKQTELADRSSKIGPYLASMAKSPEEKKPTDPKVKIVPGQNYSLNQVWKGLPQELRVYLDNMGLKGSTELAVAYEGGSAGSGGRWHIMEMSSTNLGRGGTRRGRPPQSPPPPPRRNDPPSRRDSSSHRTDLQHFHRFRRCGPRHG